MHVDRRHETPTSETKDCVTPTKAAGGVSMVPKGSSAPISTDVTGMAQDKQLHMSLFCITRGSLSLGDLPCSSKQETSLLFVMEGTLLGVSSSITCKHNPEKPARVKSGQSLVLLATPGKMNSQ